MACKKCKKSEPEQVITLTLEAWEKKFTFPKYWISVIAKSLLDAQKKVKIMLEYQNKSI